MAEKARPKPKKKVVKTELESPKSDSVRENIVEKVNIEESTISPFPSAVKSSSPPTEIKKDISQPTLPNTSISKAGGPIDSEPKVVAPSTPIDETISQLREAKKDPFVKLTSEYEKLSELEKNVLEIAKVILKKKKYSSELKTERIEMMSPLVEQLHSKCVAKLTYTKGFSKEVLFATIQDLKNKLWLVTDQRRTRHEILNSPILKNVIKFIHEHPGTHARDTAITEELGITRNPFIKHVMVLDAFGLIRTKKIGRTQNYFLKDVPETFDDFVVLFSNPLVVQIIIQLMQEKIGLSEIARRLGVYHGAIQYHIKNLIKMNLIIKEGKILNVNVDLLKEYNSLYKVPPFHLYF